MNIINFYYKTPVQRKTLEAVLLLERMNIVSENEWAILERRKNSQKIISNLKSLVFV
ncbi:hypothetical protein LEP1GSC081_3922 [Leptospira kirschneri str. H1]|uniref:Uncharacterized protein n=1 Tax=Leptospira kirschneri str. H1 TaxID=1049966 RepID=A0A0E2B7Y6_9LEPT|nr:hypothetical protein LEP1GSC081_3922 [Leptospira kirschneri str. H1]